MRLFLGIDLPKDIKESIATNLAHLKTSPKGWVDPHDYHLTLLFIGEADQQAIETIQTRLKRISFYPFQLELLRPEFFNRRVMYYSLTPSKDLDLLKQLVDKIYPEWVEAGSVPFLAHVTVKRWQRYEFDDLYKGVQKRPFKPVSFTVEEISLFKSETDQLGHKYHILSAKKF